MTLETLQYIFRSDSDVEIPLLKERHRILNETGKCIMEVSKMLISDLLKINKEICLG